MTDAEHDRYLRTWYTPDGSRFGLEAELPADQGVVVERALSRLAERVPHRPEDDEPGARRARLEVRRADALVQLCSGDLATDPDRDRATVVVHVEASTLLGDDTHDAQAPYAEGHAGLPNAEVEHGPVLAPVTARRLACDARLQVSLDDASGTPLVLGRLTRTPSAAMIRALRRRDRTCRFPGCDRRRYTDAHHVVWWSPYRPREPRAGVRVPPSPRAREWMEAAPQRRHDGRMVPTHGRALRPWACAAAMKPTPPG